MGQKVTLREDLSGGLITSKDPVLLEPGQLAAMQNCTYVYGSKALTRSAGRQAFATVTAAVSDIVGLRDIQFDNADHFLIALANVQGLGRMRYSSVGSAVTGSYTDVSNLTRLSGVEALDVVQWENRWFGFQGVSAATTDDTSNVCLYLTATAPGQSVFGRKMGLLPVNSMNATSVTSGVFSGGATGYYDYWVTEVAKITQDGSTLELESSFAGKPATYFLTATSQVPIITRPPSRNSNANRWRVYRSPSKLSATATAFPIGFEVMDLSISTQSFSDRIFVTTSTQQLPTQTGSPIDPLTGVARVTDIANITASGGGFATFQQVSPHGPAVGWGRAFSFSGLTGLSGLEVELKAYAATATAGNGLLVVLSPTDSSGTPLVLSQGSVYGSKYITLSATSSGTAQTVTLGGSTDMWTSFVNPNDGSRSPALTLTDTDVNASRVAVLLQGEYPTANVFVDYVKLRVYSDGSQTTELPFPSVAYTVGDETVAVAKNGPPPSSAMGDLYNDQLVVNDLSNVSMIRYSSPEEPEYFPAPYYLDFETGDNDQVTMIKTVNNRLVVALRHSLWRVNYLPSEADATFDRGRAKEQISGTFGCVGPMLCCTFSPAGAKEQLAFVSDFGIHVTDGDSFETISTTVNWRSIISTDITSAPIALINHPEQRELIFYYRNDAIAPETCLALRFNYSSTHMADMREDQLKTSGPTHMRNYDADNGVYAAVKSAWPVRHSDGSSVVYLGYGESPASPQLVHGTADQSIASWLASSTAGSAATANLWSYIDEFSSTSPFAPDPDLIYVTATGVNYQMGLASATAPADYHDHTLSIRTRKSASINSSTKLGVSLYCAGTAVATRSTPVLSSGLTTYQWTLTKDERLAITDYANLSVYLAASGPTDGGRYEVSWFELSVPGIGYTSAGASKVYIEKGTTNIPAYDPAMMWRTRDIYHAGIGTEWRLDKLYNYLSNCPGRPTLAYTARSIKTNALDAIPVQSPEYTLSGEKLHRVQFMQQGEGISIEMAVVADHDDMSDEFIVLKGESFGEEDSGL